MRQIGAGLMVLAIAGCTAETAAPSHEPEVTACIAAVAAHVGKGADAVAASWTGATVEGTGIVTVTDAQGDGAERLHTCEVDNSGRVLAIRHPGA